jgi:hypothetical protein
MEQYLSPYFMQWWGPNKEIFEITPILGHTILKAGKAGGAMAPWPMEFLWPHSNSGGAINCPLAHALPMAMISPTELPKKKVESKSGS